MAQAKQGKQDKKSAKADKAKKAKEPEKVQVKAAVVKAAEKTGAKAGAKTAAAKNAAEKAESGTRAKAGARTAAAKGEKAKAVAAKAEKSAEVAKVAAAHAPKAETAERDEAQRAKEEFKAAKAAAKAVLKAEDRELEPAAAKKLVEQVAAEIIAADAASAAAVLPTSPLTELLRLKPGAPVDLAALDTRATPGVRTRAQAEAELAVLSARVSELQERLYAAAVGGSKRRVLLVLQGMDTSGKGGTVRHVAGLLDPNGTRIKAFKAPTPEELEHDFLWRIRENTPVPGQVGIFDRSQYEDVLVAKVRKLALPMHIGRRYGSINRFEKSLADDGCVVVKCFLHISPAEQRERLLARLENPDKHWKYSPSDVDDRLLWPEFQEAYRIALERCGTVDAPWHVIPADRKWYRNYAVLRLLIEALESIDPQYPAGAFDLEQERARVLAS
jgi:PPK2 family polyphosphate:nucleotide phosphotransferase